MTVCAKAPRGAKAAAARARLAVRVRLRVRLACVIRVSLGFLVLSTPIENQFIACAKPFYSTPAAASCAFTAGVKRKRTNSIAAFMFGAPVIGKAAY